MTSEVELGPFNTPTVAEVHLPHAPLIRVLAQVAWPLTTTINAKFSDIAQGLAAALADTYPLPSTMQPLEFEIDPAGQMQQKSAEPIHKFSSVDENWSVYLSTTFVTLETSKYATRADMLQRLETVLEALKQVAEIPIVGRLGFRYVNRISEQEVLKDLADIVNPPVLGTQLIPLPADVTREHSISQALFTAPKGRLSTKWAFLPAGASHDPTIEPADQPSWILDLDAFGEEKIEFEVSSIIARTDQLASLAYSFFRWAVKDDFLSKFGGTL